MEYDRKQAIPYFVMKNQIVSPALLRISYELSLAFVLAILSDYMGTTLPEIS